MNIMVTPSVTHLVELVGDVPVPCDYHEYDWCGKQPAKWTLLVFCPKCGAGGWRLAGTDCKDLFLGTEDMLECDCGLVDVTRAFIKRVEAL